MKIERPRLVRLSQILTFMYLSFVFPKREDFLLLNVGLRSADVPVACHFLSAYTFLESGVRIVRRFVGLMAISDFLVV